MKTSIIATVISLITAFNLSDSNNYYGDLISKNKSDSAIKYLKPPLSITVMQNRPNRGFYYFFSNKKPKFDKKISSSLKNNDALDKIISDPKVIRKTLGSADPTRLTPSTLGPDFRGIINRNRLRELSETVDSDIILIYRRELSIQSAKEFSIAFFQNPELFLNVAETDFIFQLTTKGLVYISKQKKVINLAYNNQNISITKGQSDFNIQLDKAVRNGLKKLAEEAKKKIRAQKKIITKSY